MCNVQRGQSQKIATFSKLELKYSIFPFDDGKMKRSHDYFAFPHMCVLVFVCAVIKFMFVCMFVSLYVLYEIMWNACVTLIYSFIMYILICTSRSLLQCCTSKSNVV